MDIAVSQPREETKQWRKRISAVSTAVSPVLAALIAIAILAALTLLFYSKIAFSDRILVSYDLFTYFYPYKAYAAEALRGGHIPLWNPYIFGGVPFLANIQTAVFYPVNLVLYLFGPDAPHSVNLSIIFHVFLAGLGMYGFAKVSMRLDHPSAIVAGIVFMFSGFLSQQVGHINQQNAAAWIPVIFLFFEVACRKKSAVFTCLTAVAIALQFLAGHSQESYLTLFSLGLFYIFQLVVGVGRAFNLGEKSITGVRRHLLVTARMLSGALRETVFISAIFGVVLTIGFGLAALQLLPTYELSGESIRGGGLSYRDAASFSLPPWEILRALLPGFLENPFSEYVGYVGFLPLALAILAFAVRKLNVYTLFALLLAAIGIFFALGGYNPFYPTLFKLIPGISLFRVPARWLFVYTFAISIMAGIGMSCLTKPPAKTGSAREFIRSIRSAQFWVVLTLLLVFGVVWLAHPLLMLPRGEVLAIWVPLVALSLALILVGLLWAPDPKLTLGVMTLITLELFFAQSDLDLNHPVPPQAFSSLRPSILQLKLDESLFRTLSISIGTFDPGDMGDLRLILRDQLPPERITDYVVATKYKEILTPNLPTLYKIPSIDGYDGGVLPLREYADFKRVIIDSEDPAHGRAPGSHFDQADGLLREQLDAIPDTQLLGMLNVKYILTDKAHDPWVDNVYYDLGSLLRVNTDTSQTLTGLPSFATTAIGIVSYLSGAQNLTTTTPVATVTITDVNGRVVTATLAAGIDTAEGDYNRPGVKVAHKMARVSSLWKGNPQAYNFYTKVDLKGATFPKEIKFTSVITDAELDLRGVSLIDERTYVSEPLVLNPRLKLVHSGDVKIYENLDWMPRAFIVRRFDVAQGDNQLAALKKDVRDKVVLTAPPPFSESDLALMAKTSSRTAEDKVELESYEPERARVEVNLKAPALLVLTDPYYPGWQATVDGQPATILRADYMFRALALPAGEHSIEFYYQPESLRAGVFLTSVFAGVTATGIGFAFLAQTVRLLFQLVRSRRFTVKSLLEGIRRWRA